MNVSKVMAQESSPRQPDDRMEPTLGLWRCPEPVLGKVWLLQTRVPLTSSVPTPSADPAFMQHGLYAQSKQRLSFFLN